MQNQQRKKDIRAIRTQNNLKEALVRLLIEQPEHAVSVSAITALCNLNRNTFYLHCASVAEILKEMDETVVSSFSEIVEGADLPQVLEQPDRLLSKLIQATFADPIRADFLFRTQPGLKALSHAEDRICDLLLAKYQEVLQTRDIRSKPSIRFLVSGLFSGLRDWYLTPDHPPVDVVHSRLLSLMEKGVFRAYKDTLYW